MATTQKASDLMSTASKVCQEQCYCPQLPKEEKLLKSVWAVSFPQKEPEDRFLVPSEKPSFSKRSVDCARDQGTQITGPFQIFIWRKINGTMNKMWQDFIKNRFGQRIGSHLLLAH